jgi:hypothetical protein
MTNKDLYMRVKHAQNRPSDAFRRLTRRIVLKMIGVDFTKQTEIQYVELGHFNSKILSKIKLTSSEEIEFNTDNSTFRHNFDSKFLIQISNVLVNTETNHIYVSEKFTDNFKLLKESSSWPTELALFNGEKPVLNSIQKVGEASLGLPNNGFYHWLSDDLPDFLIGSTNTSVISYKNTSRTNLQVIELLGKKTINCDKWILVEKLTFVTKGLDLGYIHPAGAKALKEFAHSIIEHKPIRSEKIYISRSKSRRSIASENIIEEYLAGKGFKIVHAENLTFLEQVIEFSAAKLVIGIHGAGLSNALWSEECELIELMPNDRINRCFEWQTQICKSAYHALYFDPKLSADVTVIPQLDALNL